MRTIKVVKKPDSRLIQCPRLWHSSWGDVFGKVGNGSMELNIFLLRFISIFWALVFVSGSQKFNCVLHFVFIMGLVLIL
jgi:hypothetical protein